MELDAVESVRMALMEALVLALPILGAGLVIGLIISLFQAVTQIQEQMLVAVVLLSWLTVRMSDFAVIMFSGG
jgi:flagellar biosynthetic protein FliQ